MNMLFLCAALENCHLLLFDNFHVMTTLFNPNISDRLSNFKITFLAFLILINCNKTSQTELSDENSGYFRVLGDNNN
jgi:hypothetical protein